WLDLIQQRSCWCDRARGAVRYKLVRPQTQRWRSRERKRLRGGEGRGRCDALIEVGREEREVGQVNRVVVIEIALQPILARAADEKPANCRRRTWAADGVVDDDVVIDHVEFA